MEKALQRTHNINNTHKHKKLDSQFIMFRAFRQTIGNTNKFARQQHQQQRNLTTAPFDTYEGGKKILKDAVPKAWGMAALVMIGGPLLVAMTEEDDKKIYVFSEESKPRYLNVRNKPYMWDCYKCSLFDRECHKQCKKENEEKKAAWESM